MRLNSQVLHARSTKPLNIVEYLNLSDLDLERIEKIGQCKKLKKLSLRNNQIDYVSGLENCSQLWHLDLANNKIKNLDGLSCFVAFGSLHLNNNDIAWFELSKISHIHFLELSLHGNKLLENDPYYRMHVVDCLPNAWVLDGRIVTSAEKLQVEMFFEDSALTDHPVRHKLSQPSSNIWHNTKKQTFGENVVHLMKHFPINGCQNIDLDRRRLRYLCFNLQNEIFIVSKILIKNFNFIHYHRCFLEELISYREQNIDCCNMLLLLLIASLEFSIPTHLMKLTLETTRLDNLCKFQTMLLFLLPKDFRCKIASLLLCAVKIDKDVNKEGGLYNNLYLSLYSSMSCLTKLSQGNLQKTASSRNYRHFIAAEVIQLLCIVPAFFDYVSKDSGIIELLSLATMDQETVDLLTKLAEKKSSPNGENSMYVEEMANILLTAVKSSQNNSRNLVNSEYKYILKSSNSVRHRPKSTPICQADYHTSGRSSPLKNYSRNRKNVRYTAKLGDKVLLGPQNMASIISLPEPDLILVQMDSVISKSDVLGKDSGFPDKHYMYVHLDDILWDQKRRFWRPKGTIGDRITVKNISNSDDSDKTLVSTLNPQDSSICGARNLIEEKKSKNKKECTISASENFKNKWNLKLEVKGEPAIFTQVPTLDSRKTKTKCTQRYAIVTQYGGAQSLLAQSHNFDFSQSGTFFNPERHYNSPIPLETYNNFRDNHPDEDQSDDQSQSSVDSHQSATTTQSMRSSLESGQEFELENLEGDQSRQTPACYATNTNRMDGTPEQPIEIPQVSHCDPDIANEDAETLSKKMGLLEMKSQPLSNKNRDFNSNYQRKRTEAWKTGTGSQQEIAARKSSPLVSRSRTCSRSGSVAAPRSGSSRSSQSVGLSLGNTWLADGRDLYWESYISRPFSSQVPGWKEGLTNRPKSAAAFRANRRSKTLTISTPSSITYDNFNRDVGHHPIIECYVTEDRRGGQKSSRPFTAPRSLGAAQYSAETQQARAAKLR